MAKPKDVIKQIRKATRRKFSADEKIRIVLTVSRELLQSAAMTIAEGSKKKAQKRKRL